MRDTKFTAYALSSCIAGIGGVAYAYASTKVTVDSFGILVALQFVAFAYIGGITMIPGAVFAGLMTTDGVIPHVLDAELGLPRHGSCSSPAWRSCSACGSSRPASRGR